jgi:hypothetical protein
VTATVEAPVRRTPLEEAAKQQELADAHAKVCPVCRSQPTPATLVGSWC